MLINIAKQSRKEEEARARIYNVCTRLAEAYTGTFFFFFAAICIYTYAYSRPRKAQFSNFHESARLSYIDILYIADVRLYSKRCLYFLTFFFFK